MNQRVPCRMRGWDVNELDFLSVEFQRLTIRERLHRPGTLRLPKTIVGRAVLWRAHDLEDVGVADDGRAVSPGQRLVASAVIAMNVRVDDVANRFVRQLPYRSQEFRRHRSELCIHD